MEKGRSGHLLRGAVKGVRGFFQATLRSLSKDRGVSRSVEDPQSSTLL